MKGFFACLLGAALLAACQSTDVTPSKVLGVLTSPSARSIAGLASAGDRDAALRALLKQRALSYERNPRAFVADLNGIKRDLQRLEALLTGKVSRSWGQKETKLPGRTRYVKYTQNYKSRAVVDFDTGRITVETLDDKDPRGSLKNAIVTTLLTPDDPRAVDLYSDKGITLSSDKDPYLLGLVLDQDGKSIRTPAQAERYAGHLLKTDASSRKLTGSPTTQALSVEIAMVANFAGRQAEKYRPLVEKYAGKYKVSPSLVYAVIRTESNFNPFAVSPAPAYGMMQLVPASGGREAYKYARGRDEMPTREYLFDAGNNIELGTAYLGVLFDQQMDYIANPTSREYCVISAYNTGPSNVLRSFAKDRVAAVNAINSLEPPAVYDRLRQHLPYKETRDYLAKVVNFRRQFLDFGG